MMNEAFSRFACCWMLVALVLPGWAAATPDFRPRGRALALPVADNDRALAPALAMDADGDLVLAYESQPLNPAFRSRVLYLRMSGEGRSFGLEPVDESALQFDQRNAAVAMDAEGAFVIVWESFGRDGDVVGVFARRFDASGQARGAAFQVNVRTQDSQSDPAVAMSPPGDFVVVWNDTDFSGEQITTDVIARVYGRQGEPLTSELTVNTLFPRFEDDAPAVAMDGNGRFVVAYTEQVDRDGLQRLVFARAYTLDGSPGTADPLALPDHPGDQFHPDIAASADGNFFATWVEKAPEGTGVRLRRLAAAAEPLGQALTVLDNPNPDFSPGFLPRLAVSLKGEAVVVSQTLSSNAALARKLALDRQPPEGPLYVLPHGVEDDPQGFVLPPEELDVAMDVDGDFAMAWSEQDQGSGFRSQIFLRRFRGAEPIDLAATVRDNLGRGRAAVAGEELRYTAIVKNLHAPLRSSGVAAIDRAFGAARGVEAILSLPLRPARRVVFEPRDRGRCRVLPNAVRCTLEGPLAADTEARIRFRLTPTTQDQLTSSMSVFSAALESRRQLENNTAIEITNVGSAPSPTAPP